MGKQRQELEGLKSAVGCLLQDLGRDPRSLWMQRPREHRLADGLPRAPEITPGPPQVDASSPRVTHAKWARSDLFLSVSEPVCTFLPFS